MLPATINIFEKAARKAGRLLDNILKAINRNRSEGVYIANIVKCRPPDNRDPLQSEVKECEPYLINQINIINPKLIVALGKIAAKNLIQQAVVLEKMRNKKVPVPLRIAQDWSSRAIKRFFFIKS